MSDPHVTYNVFGGTLSLTLSIYLSLRLVRVLGTSHMAMLDDRSRRQPAVEVSCQ